MVKRATRQEIANILSRRTGISANKANNYLIKLVDFTKMYLYNGTSVKLFGICKLYRTDIQENATVSSGYITKSFKTANTGVSVNEAVLLEKEISKILIDLLSEGYKVVVTGLVSLERVDCKVKCSSSATIRGSDSFMPCRVKLDKMFKHYMEEILV